MSAITTHVLDTSRGQPAARVPVRLERFIDAMWQPVCATVTDEDGRARLAETAAEGRYKITFSFGDHAFYPEIAIQFQIRDARHHHIPLLLSPFGYSTYRGS